MTTEEFAIEIRRLINESNRPLHKKAQLRDAFRVMLAGYEEVHPTHHLATAEMLSSEPVMWVQRV